MFDVLVSSFVGLGGGSRLRMTAQEVKSTGVFAHAYKVNHRKHSLGGYGILLPLLS